jgi:hypothetical protein
MKKQIAAALAAMFVMSTATAVLAADPKWSGETRIRYQGNTVGDDHRPSDADYRLRLTFTDKINENATVKARFAMENDFNKTIDANKNYQTSIGSDNAVIDIFSVTYKVGQDTSVLVGLDDVKLTGLTLDQTYEALQFNTKVSDANVKAIVGRWDGIDTAGLTVQTKFDAASVGATYLQRDTKVIGVDAKFVSLNAGYTFDTVALTADYAFNTEAEEDDTAMVVAATVGSLKNVGDTVLKLSYAAFDTKYDGGASWYGSNHPSGGNDWTGFGVQADYQVAKNMVLTGEYYAGETDLEVEKNRTKIYLVSKF